MPPAAIIHRDLKPSNLILTDGDDDGAGRDQVKIIDFGIAKIAGEDKEAGDFRTRTGTMIGTPVYMSPEQCRGVGVTERTDVYALGIILYQALSGRPPFFSQADGDILAMHILVAPRPLRDAEPTVPQSVSEFIARMLAKDASERPTMAEVASKLVVLGEDPDWNAAAPAPLPAALPGVLALASDTSPDEPPAPPTQLTPPSVRLDNANGQSAARSANHQTPRRSRLAVAAAVGIVVASIGGALLLQAGIRPPPPLVVADKGPLAAVPASKAAPAAPSVTPLTAPAPPGVTAEPAVVRWSVRSQPPGAAVLGESGESLGQTPLVRTSPAKSGTQTILLRLPGYRDAQLSLSLSSDEEREAELVAVDPRGGGKGPKRPGKRGGGKLRGGPSAGQGKATANDTPVLLDFKTKKVLKTQ